MDRGSSDVASGAETHHHYIGASGHTHKCFVAIGDSFTEGLSDYRTDESLRGWADRAAWEMARQFPDLKYANLAVRGRKLGPIATQQVPAALDLNPDLISIGAGANDIIRLATDVASLNRLAHATIGRLTDSGAHVAVFTGFDPRIRMPGTRWQGSRAEVYNQAIRRAAAHFDATLIELWDLPRLYEDMMWAPDRLHLSSAGHQLIACAFLDALHIPHSLVPPAPAPEVGPPTKIETARWITRDVLPWAYRGLRGRSSGDGREPKFPSCVPARSLEP